MEQENKSADLLYGCPAIAAFLGLSEHATYHLMRKQDFPSFKLGGKVCARPSSLNEWLAEQEAKARAQ